MGLSHTWALVNCLLSPPLGEYEVQGNTALMPTTKAPCSGAGAGVINDEEAEDEKIASWIDSVHERFG